MIIFSLIMFYVSLVFIIDYIVEGKTCYNIVFIIFITNIGILSILGLFNIVLYFILIIFLLLIRCLFKLFYSKKEYIIKDNKINFNIKNNKYTFNKLLKDLKRNNIKNIDNVSDICIKNNNMIIDNKPSIFIKNGEVDYNTLRKIGKDSIWLSYNISKNKLRLDNIRLAFYTNGCAYFVKSN